VKASVIAAATGRFLGGGYPSDCCGSCGAARSRRGPAGVPPRGNSGSRGYSHRDVRRSCAVPVHVISLALKEMQCSWAPRASTSRSRLARFRRRRFGDRRGMARAAHDAMDFRHSPAGKSDSRVRPVTRGKLCKRSALREITRPAEVLSIHHERQRPSAPLPRARQELLVGRQLLRGLRQLLAMLTQPLERGQQLDLGHRARE
jgi:hypothetical protein